jgi:hypothetical protein
MKLFLRVYVTDLPEVEFDANWTPYNYGQVVGYETKPDNWREGTFESGPIFLERGIGETHTRINFEREGDHLIGTFVGHIYKFQYQCFHDPTLDLPYVVLGSYKRSIERITEGLIFIQTTHLISILEENSLEEILHKIIEEVNGHSGMKMRYEYDRKLGHLKMSVAQSILEDPLPFEIRLHKVDRAPQLVFPGDDVKSFLRFLNQDDSFDNYKYLVEPSLEKEFMSDVWDRKRVQFHSTFSDARNKYIGSNGDHFDTPSKLYRYVLTDPTFYIRFTTDGRHNFLPRYASIIIELCFILNYQRTVLLD